MKSKKINRQRFINFLAQHKSQGKTLNVGSGNAYNPKEFFPNKINVDIDETKKPDIVASIYSLPFSEAEFDNVLCLEVLEHLFYPQKAIDEMYRVLKPGGKLILTTRFIFPLHDVPGDYFRFTKYGLQKLFDKKWLIETLESETGSLETIAVLLQRMIFQAKFKANKFIKLILFCLMKIFLFLNKFIKKEFGNIEQTKDEKNILTSGYYLIAKKIKPQ